MLRTIWSQSNRGHSALAVGLAALLVATVFASAAAAAPAMYYRGATLSDNTVVVGEPVAVTATVENVGEDGGGYTFEFRYNTSRFASTRVTVAESERRSVTRNVSFARPGTYEIAVSGEVAGYVEVRRAALRVADESDGDRSLTVKARGVATSQAQTFDVPATNQSVALERWSVRTEAGTYNQTLTEYTTPTNASVTVPPADQSSLVGLVTVDSDAAVEEATARVAVNRSALEASGLGEEEVTMYQGSDGQWTPLETSVVSTGEERVVYEATGTGASAYALGEIRAGVSVADTTIRTAATDGGQRIILEATLRNNGTVDTEYDAGMVVNGAQVNTTTVTVPADGEASVTLVHEVSEAESYGVALNDQSAGTVIITAGQVSDSDETPGGADGVAVPATVLGVDTLYVGGAVGVVLVLLLGGLLVARRRGGSDDPPNSFDDW